MGCMIQHAVDLVALALHGGQLHILLIQRANEPFQGRWALPGGHVKEGEGLKRAALREAREEANLEGLLAEELAQVGTFGNPKRDPRGHVISTAFVTCLRERVDVFAEDDAKEVSWFPLDELDDLELAFDHHLIIQMAMERIQIAWMGSKLGADKGTTYLSLRPETKDREESFRVAGCYHPDGVEWNENDDEPNDE